MKPLSERMLRKRAVVSGYKETYALSREKVAKQVVQLEAMLQQTASDAFDSEVVETHMLELELEANPWVGAKQYKEGWIEAWIDALKESVT